MPHRCRFDRTKKCGYSDDHCEQCEIRRQVKQQLLVPEPPSLTKTVTIDFTAKIFCCPFCLYRADITKFYVRIKKGVSDKRFKCPDCDEIMQRNTLTTDMAIEEYAQWVYDTRAWKRIRFDTWKKRLNEYRWNWKFWNEYKRYKTEKQGATETYEQYVERKQREDYSEDAMMHEEEED